MGEYQYSKCSAKRCNKSSLKRKFALVGDVSKAGQ